MTDQTSVQRGKARFCPDFAQADRFLTGLDETADTWTFQTFDDNKDRKDPSIVRVLNSTLEQHWPELCDLSSRGAGVFVTVNETNGNGRKAADIIRVRVVFQEADVKGAPEPPLQAHIVVESSPGKFHRYYLVDGDIRFDLFEQVENRLVQDYASDPNAKDRSRVLRVPGFPHQKDPDNPWMVRIIHESGEQPYSWDAITAKIPPLLIEKKSSAIQQGCGLDDPDKMRSALEAINPDIDREHWLNVGMALHHATNGGSDGLDLFDRWSKKGAKYVPGDTQARWDSFGKYAGTPVTLATIYKLATDAGWQYSPIVKESDLAKEVREIVKSNLSPIDLEIALKDIAKKAKVSPKTVKQQVEFIKKQQQQQVEDSLEAKALEVIKELNQKHSVVRHGNRVYILGESYDPIQNRTTLSLLSQSDFRLEYLNKYVYVQNGDSVDKVCWADYWLKHPDRRQYQGIVFEPGQAPTGFYNLWKGFAITPKSGNCALLRRHIREVICNSDNSKYDYLWKWCSHGVQRPWELPETAVVLRSGQGTGKNTFVDAFGAIFGRHYVSLNQNGLLCGRFTAHLADAIVVFANEAVWGGDKSSEGRLKAMITDANETIEGKGKDPITIRNFKRIIVASNEQWAVPRGIDDRRFFCLDVSPVRVGDRKYFEALHNEINSGGIEAFLYELLETDLEGWHPRHSMPHGNTDGEDMKRRSLSDPLKWWLHALIVRSNTLAGTEWETTATIEDMHKAYLQWSSDHRKQHVSTLDVFMEEIKKAFDFMTKRLGTTGPRPRLKLIPSLDTCRLQFQEKIAKYSFIDEDTMGEGENDNEIAF